MTTTIVTTQRYLTEEQIASYHREGYLAIPRLIDAERVGALRRVTEAFVERSRSVSRTDGSSTSIRATQRRRRCCAGSRTRPTTIRSTCR